MLTGACQENNLPTNRQAHRKNILKKGGLLHPSPFTLRNREKEITVWLQKRKRYLPTKKEF
jgi:hypothetical protein